MLFIFLIIYFKNSFLKIFGFSAKYCIISNSILISLTSLLFLPVLLKKHTHLDMEKYGISNMRKNQFLVVIND